MDYSYNKLRGRIVELYGTQDNFAKELGVSRNAVSKKMNCKTEFSQKDIVKWATILKVHENEYGEYFFA